MKFLLIRFYDLVRFAIWIAVSDGFGGFLAFRFMFRLVACMCFVDLNSSCFLNVEVPVFAFRQFLPACICAVLPEYGKKEFDQ